MIEDLSKLRSIKLDIDTKQLKKKLENLADFRNAIAHGIWLKHPQTKKPVLQIVAGNYEPAPGQQPVKARIDPKALEMGINNLKGIRTGIGAALITIGKLKSEIDRKLST